MIFNEFSRVFSGKPSELGLLGRYLLCDRGRLSDERGSALEMDESILFLNWDDPLGKFPRLFQTNCELSGTRKQQ